MPIILRKNTRLYKKSEGEGYWVKQKNHKFEKKANDFFEESNFFAVV